jgi:hypothetical protein
MRCVNGIYTSGQSYLKMLNEGRWKDTQHPLFKGHTVNAHLLADALDFQGCFPRSGGRIGRLEGLEHCNVDKWVLAAFMPAVAEMRAHIVKSRHLWKYAIAQACAQGSMYGACLFGSTYPPAGVLAITCHLPSLASGRKPSGSIAHWLSGLAPLHPMEVSF